MRIGIGYFYQIRYFAPWMIPVSTAVSDPKWFHDFKGKDNVFIDKRGVRNGIRTSLFCPSSSCNGMCSGKENCETKNPNECMFLKTYAKQLSLLTKDKIMDSLNFIAERNKSILGFKEEPTVVLMVYETNDNPCSERTEIMKLFDRLGIEYKLFHF